MTTINKIISATPSIEKLLSQELSIGVAVKLSKIQKELTEILKIYDEKRIKLLDLHGTKGETKYEFTDEAQAIFVKELGKILEEDLETGISLISISELGDIKLSAMDVSNLDFILAE